MKRLKAMSNRDWVQKYKPDFGGMAGCPSLYGLDNDCLQFNLCSECWCSPAKRNGRFIMKVVQE